MGWPPCMAPGCTVWPSGREMFLCDACIRDPEKVHNEHKRVVDVLHKLADDARTRCEALELLLAKPAQVQGSDSGEK